ncbi:sodium-independent sulfate anion transporter-like [Wyeomyia smithii]|uniref:sodium-independent sulfate anion transporter-like n=1 Tax=Wyeomyia smithii TaxID=174621 RepID=UPI002468102F|nr:sodium-independent sulfate anion transporter-like [Wyeomyia smithii]XP_055530541.1 sodium-independent sulfate anion transporter-like [Wyeomyia smithii]
MKSYLSITSQLRMDGLPAMLFIQTEAETAISHGRPSEVAGCSCVAVQCSRQKLSQHICSLRHDCSGSVYYLPDDKKASQVMVNQNGLFHQQQPHERNVEDYGERLPNLSSWIRERFCNICSLATVRRRIHVLQWLPRYQLNHLPSDIIAGVTVTLTAIPQSIAYGILANLQPQDGIYSNLVGCLIYFLFGSVKDVTIAPTSIMAIMIQGVVLQLGYGAALLTLLAGAITFLFGVLNLGILVRFISMPVITGFTTAACLTIGSSQLRSLFGISSPGKSSDFMDAWENVIINIGETRLWDTVLGFSSIGFLVIFRLTKKCGQGSIRIIFKYLSLLRNALIVVIGATLAYVFFVNGVQPFKLTGHVNSGVPPFHLPPFSITNNGTFYSFSDMISTMGTSIIAIPLVSTLEIISIGKAFSKNKIVDATQEMIALGVCNMAVSFVSPLPVAGSFTRTAINNSSGVKTSLGCAITSILLLASLALLADAFYYIPKATLASVIISAMIFMVDYRGIGEIWRVKKLDMIPLIGTILASIFLGLDYGILVGIAINCCFLLYLMAAPKISMEVIMVEEVSVLVVKPMQDLAFSSAEYLRERIVRAVMESYEAPVELLVMDGTGVNFVDTTVTKNLASVEQDMHARDLGFSLWNWSQSTAGALVRLDRRFLTALTNEPELAAVVRFWKENHMKEA